MIQQQKSGRSLATEATHILRTLGPLSVYKGLSATLLRESLYASGYLAVAPLLREALADQPAMADVPGGPLVVSGVAAGLLATLATQPFDTIKTRMQVGRVAWGGGKGVGQGRAGQGVQHCCTRAAADPTPPTTLPPGLPAPIVPPRRPSPTARRTRSTRRCRPRCATSCGPRAPRRSWRGWAPAPSASSPQVRVAVGRPSAARIMHVAAAAAAAASPCYPLIISPPLPAPPPLLQCSSSTGRAAPLWTRCRAAGSSMWRQRRRRWRDAMPATQLVLSSPLTSRLIPANSSASLLVLTLYLIPWCATTPCTHTSRRQCDHQIGRTSGSGGTAGGRRAMRQTACNAGLSHTPAGVLRELNGQGWLSGRLQSRESRHVWKNREWPGQ